MHKKKIVRRKTNHKIKSSNKRIKKTKCDITAEDYQKAGIYTNINKNITESLLQNVPQVQTGFNDRLLKSKEKSKLLSQLTRQEREQSKEFKQIEVEEMTQEQLQQLLGIQPVKQKDEDFHKKKLTISIDDQWALEKIVKKHGTNFKKAHMDQKVNTYMWNETQLQKKYDIYVQKFGKCPK